MFLIPTGTDRDDGRRPFFVPLIVAACVAVFVISLQGDGEARWKFVDKYGVAYVGFEWWQLFTHQFLHGGWFHLIGNMFFLAAFGIVLESRLGHLGFLAFYLLGGALAGAAQVGIGHLIDPAHDMVPCVGASGAISALMGAVFALHPRANIRGIAIPQFVRAQTSVQWMVGFAVALDIARTIVDRSGHGGSGIATLAHLGGLGSGFAIGVLLLATGILKRNDFDALYLFKQWRRRRELRSAASMVGARVAATAAAVETPAQRTLRTTIAAAHRERDYTLAAQLYAELLAQLPSATLPAEIQLDVANEFARTGRHAQAAAAYGRFVERFRTHPAADDVRLLLAAIQVRRLGDARGAMTTLAAFDGRDLDDARAQLVKSLRDECEASTRGARA